MNDEQLIEQILNEFAQKQNINLPNNLSLQEKMAQLEEKLGDGIDRNTEMEITLTAEITTGDTIENLLTKDWAEYEKKHLTMEIADDGFSRWATITDVEITDIYDW